MAAWIIRTASARESVGLPMWKPLRSNADTRIPARPSNQYCI